jgi:arylsulfatase A-like enzyme
MTRNSFARRARRLTGLAAALLLASAPHAAHAGLRAKPARPNLIFLLADDLRWDALGCAGNPVIRTPNLDGLARKGVRFRNAFVTTSICAVSRASILTGQYARRHKINDFKTDLAPEAFARTYVALLRAAGYRVGFIGKYGVGANLPARAFDYWRGFPGQGSYFQKGEAVHLTRRMGDQALEFLKGCDRQTPFCLSVSFKCPHAMDGAPREFPPDPRDEQLYEGVTIQVPKTAAEKYYRALPEFVQKSEGRRRWQRRYATPEQYQKVVRDYYRLVTGMDREVGRILAALEQLGFADNTVVIFSSDNGFFLGERGMADKWLMYARISQMARPFRHGVCAFSRENPAFPTLSCRNDRDTQWVTAKMTPSASILIAKSSSSSTVRPSPVTPDSLPTANSTTPSD